MEGLRVAEANLTVYIHPSKARKSRHAILRELSSLLFTYSEVFDGVILAFEVDIKYTCRKILPGLIPNFGVELKANLLLFSPMMNNSEHAYGKVVMLGKESIHAIVLGFSSASTMSEDLREELKFNVVRICWNMVKKFFLVPHKRHMIKVGSIVRFLVKSFDEELLHISGSLLPPDTGCVPWLSKRGIYDASHIDRHQKRHREGNSEKDLLEDSDLKCNHYLNRSHTSRKRTE